jgi:2-C-methyl-D-erythritol 2,4-cyclodiphosphate synthase
MRIGTGYDIHRFEETSTNDFIVLGGVTIPYESGMIAHSDGDVCLHAICDALLGSVALGDMGQHFPDTDPLYRNCDSRQLVREVVAKLHAIEYTVVNIDVTIIAQKPKLQPYIMQMREIIASDVNVSVYDISIKAKTNEGLDAVGKKEAIAAHAVVLVRKKS